MFVRRPTLTTLALTILYAAAIGGSSFPRLHAAGKELTGAYTPASSVCPTPEEAARKMTVPEGYEVRCFAHEPMIINPVAMTWDHRGRLWVVEAYEYPEGTQLANPPFGGPAKDGEYHPVPAYCKGTPDPKHPIPMDRIVILEDTHNTGVADKRTVFVEGLNMASAIVCGDGGVYVGQQPHMLHFRDTDGDDHADEWRVVFTGFGREDTHELLNSFTWGPDGWLYMTHGVFTQSRVRLPGQPESAGFRYNAGIARCHPLTGEFEVFADGTSNPWGVDFDARGNAFVEACVIDHFFHMAPGGIYVRQGGAPENPYAYELLPSIVHHKHFRAAYAGIQCYQANVYPKDTHGHFFIGNIHDNAIHEEVVTPQGSSFLCEPRRDFLRANDGWFRPVSTQTGPDGNLWIMDWCDKYPCYQNAKANPEGVDREKGRIWRVVYTGKKKEDVKPGDTPVVVPTREKTDLNLKETSTADLVKLLSHSNNWVRRTARRMLVERKDAKAVPLLIAVVKEAKSTSAKLDALWTLHDGNFFQTVVDPRDNLADMASLLEYCAAQEDAGLRIWAARLIGDPQPPFYSPDAQITPPAVNTGGATSVGSRQIPLLQKLASDPDPAVRAAVAIACRKVMAQASGYPLALTVDSTVSAAKEQKGHLTIVPYPAGQLSPAILTNLANASKDADRTLAFHIWMALEPNLAADPKQWLAWLGKIAANDGTLAQTLTYKAMRRVCDTHDPKDLDTVPEFLAAISASEPNLRRALDGLQEGQEAGIIKPTVDTTELFAKLTTHSNQDIQARAKLLAALWGNQAATTELVTRVLSPQTPDAERLQDLQTLRKAKNDATRKAVLSVLEQAASAGLPRDLVIEAIHTAGDLGGAGFMPLLVQLSAAKNAAVRTADLEALASRADWAHAMLDAVAGKKINPSDFSASVRRLLATLPDKTIQKQATQLLGAFQESSADIKNLIATKRKVCMEGTPDLAAGKVTFQTTCMVCHSFYGGGQKVGPDLIGSGRSSLDSILSNVIDPNQVIGNGYENYICTTKDNRVVTGRLTEDTPNHVKLLTIGGVENVVPREQIAKIDNTHQSVMPVGFGNLPDDVFRNLVWYVLAPPDEGPLTAEKKTLLSTPIEGAAKKKKGTNWHAPDWESISLWNPKWTVIAPEFERTPVKLSDYHGRHNVLLMHPFDQKKPSALERKVTLDAGKPHKLSFYVASHDQGDWELHVIANGKNLLTKAIGHDGERWKHIEVDLSAYAGQEVNLRLEGAANGWNWEFGYWSDITLE